MALPTRGETFSKLIEYIRLAEEAAATLGHLTRDEDALQAKGWLGVSEMFHNTAIQVTKLATSRGKLQ